MSSLVIKAVFLVLFTHGIRWLGRRLGPRRGGLLLGLPSSTALVLVTCGHERGIDDSAEMAEASLLGLVGAVVLPFAYARVLGFGWRLPEAAVAAVGAYVAVAWGFSLLPPPGALACLAIAVGAVATACHASKRLPMALAGPASAAPSRFRCLALRTIVPIAYLVAVETFRDSCGPRWAGLISPFPGMTLAILVVTHLEGGAAEATRMARALPPGSWGMIAFLAVFRLSSPHVGLAWATLGGYLLASVALLSLGWSRSGAWLLLRRNWDRRASTYAMGRMREEPPGPLRIRRPRAGRRLSPLVEPVGL